MSNYRIFTGYALSDVLLLIQMIREASAALDKIAKHPKKEPKEDHWGNEDDAYYHGLDEGSGNRGEDAREALSRLDTLAGKKGG